MGYKKIPGTPALMVDETTGALLIAQAPKTATKTARTLQASDTCPLAETKTGGAVDLRAAIGDFLITAKITNGAAHPTLPCSFYVEVSNDGAAWKTYCQLTAGLANNGIYEFAVLLPAPVMYVRSRFAGNSVEDVTVEAFGHEYTSMG